ncbi:ABC transporter permease, partial [candidate division KSB1 bacterium]
MREYNTKKSGITEKILKLFMSENESESFLGDLEDYYSEFKEGKSIIRAKLWYWFQILKSILTNINVSIQWSFIMFSNYLKIALRNLKRSKVNSFINIFGLASGLAISFILAFYVLDDISYDRFHENSDNIYRIVSLGVNRINVVTSGPLVVKVKEEIPEIISSTRITQFETVQVLKINAGSNISENQNALTGRALVTDPGFFDVFS